MMKTFLLLGATLLSCYLTESRRIKPDHILLQSEIAVPHGFRADRSEFPHQVALLLEDAAGHRALLCSGAVIDAHFVLAAAHCFDAVPPLAQLLVEAGDEWEPQTRRVARIILHPEYTPFREVDPWDVALVQLRLPLSLGDSVRVIELGCQPVEGDATLTYWVPTSTLGGEGETSAGRQLVNEDVVLRDEVECQARLDLRGLPLHPTPLCSRAPIPRTLASRVFQPTQRDPGGILTKKEEETVKIIGFFFEFDFFSTIIGKCEWIYKKVKSLRTEL